VPGSGKKREGEVASASSSEGVHFNPLPHHKSCGGGTTKGQSEGGSEKQFSDCGGRVLGKQKKNIKRPAGKGVHSCKGLEETRGQESEGGPVANGVSPAQNSEGKIK